MKLGPAHTQEKTYAVVFLLGLSSILLIALPGAPSAHASPSVVSTNSSLKCEDADSLFSSSFTCSLNTTAGSTIIVFFGCLTGSPPNCNILSVADSQNNTYHYAAQVETSCDGPTCEEYAFWATASSTGTDTMTFTSAVNAYLGADVYDVSGINTTGVLTAFGGGYMDLLPQTLPGLTPYPNGFVAAGVIANDALQFTASAGYTLIPGQPCFPCGMNGGWQGSEYEMWGKSGTTTSPFGYQENNDGWAELAVSFAPNVATTSVTCAPSPVTVTLASRCTGTETGDSPTGTMTWTSNGTGSFSPSSCALSSGTCSVSYTPSVPSSPVVVTASYGGDSNNPESSGNYSLSVVKAVTTTGVTCSPSLIAMGSPTTCTASVSGVSPTGSITWASSGVANFSPATTCTLSAGSCAVDYTPSSATSPLTITAIYSGDGDNDGSSGTFTLSVAQVTATSASSSSTTSTTSSSSTTTTRTGTISASSTITTSTLRTSTSISVTTTSTTSSSSTGPATTSASSSTASRSTSIAASSSSIAGFMFPLVSVMAILIVSATSFLLRKRTSARPPTR